MIFYSYFKFLLICYFFYVYFLNLFIYLSAFLTFGLYSNCRGISTFRRYVVHVFTTPNWHQVSFTNIVTFLVLVCYLVTIGYDYAEFVLIGYGSSSVNSTHELK